MATKAQLITSWRELTGEKDTSVVSDNTVETEYLMRGAEALNRRVGYFYKDSTVSLTGGTQEYAFPADCLDVVWVELDTTLLRQTPLEKLREDEPGWRQAPAGMPRDYYLYSKIGLWPKPDAAAAALTCTVRHTATPTISSTPGFDLLATQDHIIPVYRAVSLFFEAHGQDADFARAARFGQLFDQEAERVRDYYARRRMLREP